MNQKNYEEFGELTRDWTQITFLTVSHSNHYTRMFSELLWGCNWILFMHGWFCPIGLIHLIGRKSLRFEKKQLDCDICAMEYHPSSAKERMYRYPHEILEITTSLPLWSMSRTWLIEPGVFLSKNVHLNCICWAHLQKVHAVVNTKHAAN